MRVLVTGAGGFVGGHLQVALRRSGHLPVALMSPHSRAEQGVKVNLVDPEATARAVAEASPHAVVHLAARAQPAGMQSTRTLMDNNLESARNVLEAVRCFAPHARMLVVSSSAVYGAVPIGRNPIVESEPLRPVTPYGASKVAVEALASVYAAEGLDVVVARPFNLIGPAQPDTLAAASFARQIVRVQAGVVNPVIRTGRLESVRDFTDVRDAVLAYVSLLKDDIGPGPFNVCSGVPRSIGAMLREMLTVAGLDAVIQPQAGVASTPTDVLYQCGDGSALGRAVGWKPEIVWRDSLRDILEDWKERPQSEVP